MSERLNAEPPRSRVPVIVLAIVAVIALIALTVVATSALGGDEPPVPPTSSSDSSGDQTSSQKSPSSEDGAGASGCLGGVNPTKAVLAAQEEASLDPKGAAAFAATVMRWRSQYPPDPGYAGKAKQIMTADAGADLMTVEDADGGPEDSGWASTDGARYRVTESTESTATVEIVMPMFATSKEYPDGVEVSTAARWRLIAEDGQWKVTDMDPIEENAAARQEVSAHGLTFKGVC
ncbi:hypothetical protein [Janibacter hoylei]|uniref:hypothetical protein n=1 Tax=Janibacter hoylei TaxID=364298 RepID=UPI0027BA4EB1|nr:hypothetical protein [Janibacter hoylei]